MLLDEWGLSGMPFDRTVLVTQEPVEPGRFKGVEVISGGRSWPGAIWRNLVLRPLVRRDDLLFCPTNLLPSTLASRSVLFVFDTLLESVPESFPWHVRARFGPRYRTSSRRADRILVPSESTARDVIVHHGVDPSKLRVVPLSHAAIFRPHPVTLRTSTFLVVGKRSKRRNLPAILQGFAAHRLQFPESRLTLVGPGDVEAVPEGVVVLGHVDDDRLAELYRGATATLYLSDYEGFGLPILEAQACGCPVVTLHNSALGETAGEGAFFLDRADSASVEEAMNWLMSDSELRSDLVTRGLANAARFSTARMAREVRDILREEALAALT